MDRAGIEKALRNAVNLAPEIPFDQIAAQSFIRMQEHDYITRQEPIKRVNPVRQLSFAAAMCLVIFLTVSGWYVRNKAVDSIITLDVNPSIEILTNRKDEILSVKAMNPDAQRIIGDKDYSHTRLNDTISMIINSLVENKYVNREKNAILLTVTNKNNRKADDLLTDMNIAIRDSLSVNNIEPLILSKTMNTKEANDKLAKKYDISRGKLQLIKDMIDFNHNLSLGKLAKLSVEQLLILARENNMDLSKYLKRNGGEGMPSVTEKPDYDIEKFKNKTSNDANEKSERKDNNDVKNRDSRKELDEKDHSKIRKQEDRDNEDDSKNKDNKKEKQKNKNKNIEIKNAETEETDMYSEKEETKEADMYPENAETNEIEKESKDTDNKNTLTSRDEDNSGSIGEDDEDSSDSIIIENDADGYNHEDLEGDTKIDQGKDSNESDTHHNY